MSPHLGMSLGAASGILRSIVAQENNIADVVPVDLAVNFVSADRLVFNITPTDSKMHLS